MSGEVWRMLASVLGSVKYFAFDATNFKGGLTSFA